MAVRDIEAFIRERAVQFDTNMDVTPGSPFDKQVIQPLVRRLGTDPFSVDLETFITTRMNQAYPDAAVSEGDGITDILIQPAQLLWDPFLREATRMRNGLSFRNPDQLTLEEAEALGANLFAERQKGDVSRGVGRVIFGQAQNATISPVNFFTSKSGLIFTPTESQSIRVEEMLLNDGGDGTFYFDVNLIAEKAGSEYNIGPDELSSVANLDSAVRVTNLRRFKDGDDAQTAAEFVDSAKQQLTEKSMVTLRGISAKITGAFPEVSRLNSVGFQDPEMQRDVLTGGGLGTIRSAGILGRTVADSFLAAGTTRLVADDAGVDFTQTIGPVGAAPGGFVLTVVGAFTGGVVADDLTVARVISASTIEVLEQVLVAGKQNLSWTVRKRELTLSGIPGGILFPDNAAGTVSIPNGAVHVGGAVDYYVRGASPDEATLIVNSLADDDPELSGNTLNFTTNPTQASIVDLNLGTNYVFGDETYLLLESAAANSITLQVLDGPNVGTYRIVKVIQGEGFVPVLFVSPAFPTISPGAGTSRWKLCATIDVDLADIKETRVEGGDLITGQNSDVVKTVGGTDFDALGVAKGDVLRVFSGEDVGDYTIIEAPLVPTFQQLRIDTRLRSSLSNVRYMVFRPNVSGNLQPPVVRIKSINLLDSSNQPLGTTIPYARPVDIQTRAFQNPARGVKITETMNLGLLTQGKGSGQTFASIGGTTLKLQEGRAPLAVTNINVVFSASPANKTPAQVASEINAAVFAATGEADVAVVISSGSLFYVGIRPFGPMGYVQTLPSGSATNILFGDLGSYTTNDMRLFGAARSVADWTKSPPGIDFSTGLDVFQVVTGTQVSAVPGPYDVGNTITGEVFLSSDVGILPKERNHPFAPEVGVVVEAGARSLGSARMYFLEPTSVEVRSDETFFSVATATGALRFVPDPTLAYQCIPALPDGGKPHDGETAANLLSSASQDFVNSGVQPGDRVFVDFRPVAGSIALPDPVPNLVHKTFKFALDNSAPRTLVFIRDDVSLAADEVSRAGVASQINAAAGLTLVRLRPDNHLEFDVEMALSIYGDGTANAIILGNDESTGLPFAGASPPITNKSTASNTTGYVVQEVNPGGIGVGKLLVVGNFAANATRQQFRIMRTGVQRIGTSVMAKQEAEAGLYYADIELVSEGVGDQFNIDASQQMTVTGERADGYYLTTEDSNLTFSALERPHLILSRSILESGVDDDPVNATQLLGQNIQITYERSSLVDAVNSFGLSETERVVCASPLARHLIPHYVRFDATYAGGSSEEVTVPRLEDYINNLAPVDGLESSDIQDVLSNSGATSIDNPIDLIAIVHDVDRSISAHRSQNRLFTGRLSAFVPDRLKVTRKVA